MGLSHTITNDHQHLILKTKDIESKADINCPWTNVLDMYGQFHLKACNSKLDVAVLVNVHKNGFIF